MADRRGALAAAKIEFLYAGCRNEKDVAGSEKS